MNRTQYISIGGSILLLMVLYFACETTPPGQSLIEKSRAVKAEVLDVNQLMEDAITAIPQEEANYIRALSEELHQNDGVDSLKIKSLERLSGRWFQAGHPAIAGHFAQEIASIDNKEQSWSIAATTYAICVQRSDDMKTKQFCNQRSINAFENAISLNPESVSNQVNLALTYTEMPPENQPMKGVLMLRDLQDKYPENALVLNTLARLGVQTGQFERAKGRLLQALEIEPDNQTSICLLYKVYEALGENDKAAEFKTRCQ